MTLYNNQVRAIEIGIMPEDLNQKSNVIIDHLRRMMAMYYAHLESVLQLLPPDFNGEANLKKLKEAHLKNARALTRKVKVKECDT